MHFSEAINIEDLRAIAAGACRASSLPMSTAARRTSAPSRTIAKALLA